VHGVIMGTCLQCIFDDVCTSSYVSCVLCIFIRLVYWDSTYGCMHTGIFQSEEGNDKPVCDTSRGDRSHDDA